MGRPKKSAFGGVFSIFRPIVTILVLTAFVLGISFIVKTVSTSNGQQLYGVVRPLLARFNIDDSRFGVVAGDFASRLSETGKVNSQPAQPASNASAPTPSQKNIIWSVALLADSHNNNTNLSKALRQANDLGAKFVLFLGDYTDWGTASDLAAAKKIMDAGNLTYYSLPGDHDLAQSVGTQNYENIFGPTHFVYTYQNTKFVGLDNSANYTPITEAELTWFKAQINDADFVILSQPIYSPSNWRSMGIIDGKVTDSVKKQADLLLELIRSSSVKAIVAADLHSSSNVNDPVKNSLSHIVVGALTDQINLQTPRFSILKIFTDGSYTVDDVLLK